MTKGVYVKIQYIDQAISSAERAELLFRGDIIIHRNLSVLSALMEFSDTLLRKHLAVDYPPTAHLSLDSQAFLDRSCAAQKEFRQSKNAKQLFFKVLTQVGLDPATTFYDHFPMRVVPCEKRFHGAHRSAIGHHRDTWGSNLQSQLNWWAPLYPITAQRSIALYPDYWTRPVANTTASWSFEAYLNSRAQGKEDRFIDYPSAPQPSQIIDETNAVKVEMSPGELLNFSSAQLHASVPNGTDQIRYSVEMRTLCTQDLQAKRQAPNIDNAGKEAMFQWFRSIETAQKLTV